MTTSLAKDAAASGVDGLQALKSRLDRSILRIAGLVLALPVLASVIQLIFIFTHPSASPDDRNSRLVACVAVIGIALASWGLARYRSAAAGALFLCWSAMAVLMVSAWTMDWGMASTSLAAFSALIAIGGFLVGPHMARWLTLAAVSYLIALWVASILGQTGGLAQLDPQRMASYGAVHITACLCVGWMVSRYGSLFMQMIASLDSSKRLLESTLQAEQKAARQLALSEARMRALLDNSLNAVLILDRDSGSIRYANAQLLDRHGCKSLAEFDVRLMYPEQPYTPEESLRLVKLTLEEGSRQVIWKTRDIHGVDIWWDMKLDNMLLEEAPSVVCFGHDITARVMAETALRNQQQQLEAQVKERTQQLMIEQQRMQDVIEALPITLSIRDREGRYTLVNKRFETALGLLREQVVGRPAHEFLPPAMMADMRHWDGKVLGGEGEQTFERVIPDPSGRPLDYLITSVPLLNAQREPFAVLNLGTDVTSLKTLQRELALAKEEAERLAAAKSEFLANMSHEIRTPLNAVLGIAQLGVRRTPVETPEHADYERILRSGRLLLGVINDILDYSKLDSGKLEVFDEPCELAVLLADAAEMVAERARAKGLSLSIHIDDQVPAWLRLDGLRVSQVLVNLLSNAVKFTPQGSVRLEARAEDQTLCLSVIDTGVGIAPEHLARIFDPFEQADSSTTRLYGGTGLGLSISRRLAELMDGDIVVHSESQEGSCFTLRVPLRPLQAADAPQPQVTAGTAGSLEGMRLLVVDDVEINRTIILAMLRECGASATGAPSGEAAVARLQAQPDAFDAVLMDLQMPGMDGFEATHLLHESLPDMPVIALTAHALEDQRRKCLEAGMVAHITKPVDLTELAQVLGTHLPRRHRPGNEGLLPRTTSAKPTSPPPQVLPPVPALAPHPAAPLAQPGGEWPDLPSFDRAGALSRCGGQEAVLRKVLVMFAAQLQRWPADLHQAAEAGVPELKAAAHRLKGVSGNLGLTALERDVLHLEQALAAPLTPEALSQALAPVLSELSAVDQALAAWSAR
ncbi:ATP-binding protein [Ideonella paludis]|uniref:histidine kinase n=1 Tax=Ideonella paludis TaxID=1233411 RepID=A0ABS5E1D8_9BURK|nr:ATP-binding protein [Ideonella paludis]MBQ0937241.1 response regulator [Ideonella paludis]